MPEFPLLTIDCAGFQPRVALHGHLSTTRPQLEHHRPLASGSTEPGARSAASLLPLIQRIYRDAGIDPTATRAIAVTFGPGSFTSLRIGVTTAKMLAYCWQIPAIGIQTLDYLLLADVLSSEVWPANQRWTAAINAYRQQCYCKVVQWSDAPPAAIAVDLKQRELAFQEHFSQAYTLVQPFESTTVSADSPRFQLNEQRVLQWEATFPEAIWKTLLPTDTRPHPSWLATAESADRVVTSDPQLLDAEGECDGPVSVPTDDAKDLAIAWLAGIQISQLDDWQLHPFNLQPIYYRPSAAEEALKH